MRVGNFSVLIPEGKERESGHVELDHERQYRIQLGNHCYDRRTDVTVVLDGKEIGNFRVNAGATVTLERSPHDNGRFTFFLSDSEQAVQAGVSKISTPDRGLLTAIFRAERKRQSPVVTMRGGAGGQSVKGMFPTSNEEKTSGGILTSGVTGLTGHSDQSFVSVSNLDYDPTLETVINLRLVGNKYAVRELIPSPRSNAVPNPVE